MRRLRNWCEIAADAMREAQAAPARNSIIPDREFAYVLADLRAELQSVRMAVRVRAKVDALLDELSTNEE